MKRRRLLVLLLLPALLDLLWIVLSGDARPGGLIGVLWRVYTLTATTLFVAWITTRIVRLFLWRVGRRLAASYFLIGVLPVPLAMLLLAVGGYIASGMFFSHLYHDALHDVQRDLQATASVRLEQLQRGRARPPATPFPIEYVYYRDGRRIAGPKEAPNVWQEWWDDELSTQNDRLVADFDEVPTLMSALRRGRYGLLAIFRGDLEAEVSSRSRLWVEFERFDEQEEAFFTLSTAGREYPLKFLHRGSLLGRRADRAPELAEFFHPGVEEPSWLQRPLILWGEPSGALYDPAGREVASNLHASLTGTLEGLAAALRSRSAEVDASAFVILLMLMVVLANIWMLAALMAIWMIFSLSRAVNTLYQSTQRVQRGDFAARIDVRRSDQIGALQSSFNRMTANLETLVASAAQKEALEKELSLAGEVQQSLLPGRDLGGRDLRFAVHFAPSAAIGGDYYDVLPMGSQEGPPAPEGERPLAVVVADVSGHGLSAGLRMAMVKSALQLLCEQDRPPAMILAGLHRLQKSSGDRGFVTATLARIDRAARTMTLSNAGHAPVYRIRGGDVEEIVVRGTPLGTLGNDFGQEEIALNSGDVIVWLSDGLIEAVDRDDEPFGYERLRNTLAEGAGTAEQVRDRLLEAVLEHTGGREPDDDQTLLVMVYEPE